MEGLRYSAPMRWTISPLLAVAVLQVACKNCNGEVEAILDASPGDVVAAGGSDGEIDDEACESLCLTMESILAEHCVVREEGDSGGALVHCVGVKVCL